MSSVSRPTSVPRPQWAVRRGRRKRLHGGSLTGGNVRGREPTRRPDPRSLGAATLIAVVGGVAIVAGHARANSPIAAAGVGLIIVALIVAMVNWMFRMSVQSNLEREQ